MVRHRVGLSVDDLVDAKPDESSLTFSVKEENA